jgi:DNA damage-inducible protein 1
VYYLNHPNKNCISVELHYISKLTYRSLRKELFRQNQIDENWALAMEHFPEAFVQVSMLYVKAEINGIAVPMFIDSGAQATIMSPRLAKVCGVDRLIDTRCAGVAHGVGAAPILGRVHAAQLKVGTSANPRFLMCSFTIMDTNAGESSESPRKSSVEFLFGLDMLRRHQAVLDLNSNVLRIQGVESPFLSEQEVDPMLQSLRELDLRNPDRSAESPAKPLATRIDSPESSSKKSGSENLRVSKTLDSSGVKTLMDLGASEEEAKAALKAAGGNPEVAASFLFQ